ncbi:hypothetical protein AB1I80_06655 [Bacillus paranthracis]|uniref:hypothetical protein n=1 Tax=Bacillus paranthracis TaxID=2026186 RepID=UPI003558E3B2
MKERGESLNVINWTDRGDKNEIDKKKEERRERKAKKNQQKLQERRQKAERKRIDNKERKTSEALAELNTINNDNIDAKLVQKEGGYTVGTSKHNKKWIQKRVDRYNARVWRGWRETDGVTYPVMGSGNRNE